MSSSLPDTTSSLVGSVQSTAAAYDKQSESYAAMMADELSKPLYTVHLPALAAGLTNEDVHDGVIVDVGCGPGDCLALLADMESISGFRLLGTDISNGMLKFARKRLQAQSQRAQFCCASATDSLPLPDGGASALLCYFVLHHLSMEQAAIALREWARVLCGDAPLLLACWSSEKVEAGERSIEYPPDCGMKGINYSQAEVRHLVEEAGFTVRSCTRYTEEEMYMDFIVVEAFRNKA